MWQDEVPEVPVDTLLERALAAQYSDESNRSISVVKTTTIWSDPIVVLMSAIGILLVTAAFSFVISAYTLGFLGSVTIGSKADADLVSARSEVSQFKDQPEAWFQYITQLSLSGQYASAQMAINNAATQVSKQDQYYQYIGSAQADMYYRQEKYDQAIVAAKRAQLIMTREYENELKLEGLPSRAKAYGISENFYRMDLLLAGAYRAKGQYENTIAVLEEYTKKYPMEAGVWVDLGEAYNQSGEMEKARASFEKALRYVPDFDEAKKGLAKLGER